MKQHRSECPEEAVECNFHYAGCTNLVLRKHLAIHLQKNLERHLNLQTESFLAEIEKKDEQLQQLVVEQEEQLQQLSALHRQQIEEKDKIIDGLLKKEIREIVEEKLGEGVESLRTRYSELEMNVNRLDKLSARLEREMLRYICLIHEGRHMTEIWKGKYNDRKVVIKKPTTGASSAPILQEFDVLLRLRHKNIVEVYGALTYSEPACIVMEYLPNGTLQNYLRSNNSLLLHEQVLVCKQVAQGLEYLQQKLCIHGKVGANNILLREKLHCKLSDFSLSKFIDNHLECIQTQKDYQYRIKWCAPEVIQERGFCLKSDVWSFGMLTWEVVTNGQEPYQDLSTTQAAEHIVTGTYMPRPEGCPEGLYTVMLECWKLDPWSRPTFDKLLEKLARITKISHKYSDVSL